MLGPLNISLEHFGVSHRHGFLPTQAPLRELTNPYFASWENIARCIPDLIRRRTLRERVAELPVLSTSPLKSERERQRAYVVLSFLTHGYIWGGLRPSETLPSSISIPMLEISSHLGLPPIATYAGLNLWNFAPIDLEGPLTMENLECLNTMTGTIDESWFYLISVAMEARGGEIIPTVLRAMNAVRADNADAVREYLLSLASSIQDIGVLLERMYEKCDPEVFYHQIRPFLAGTKNMAHVGLPKGVFYDEGNGKGQWRQNSGGSNAQSSLIQFFDIVLGVEHAPTGSKSVARGQHGFLEEMRNYMPGPHREFLQEMENVSNIREYITNSPCGLEVTAAYNLAVEALKDFRSKHIKIVTRYIMIPSRKIHPNENGGLNLAIASSAREGKEKGLRGTGGTELLPFLKQSRDETKETAVLD